MSRARNLADLLDASGDVVSGALDNVAGLPDAIDVNASAPADSLNINSSGQLMLGVTTPASTYGDAAFTIGTATGANTKYAVALNKAGGYGESFIGNYYTNVPDYGLAFTVGNSGNVMKFNYSGNLTVPGGIYLGGTGAANHLDDYEEGYWLPYISGSVSGSVTSFTERLGWYVKVGGVCHVSFYLANPGANGGTSGAWYISGLPFTSKSLTSQGYGTNYYSNGPITYNRGLSYSGSYLTLAVGNGWNYALISQHYNNGAETQNITNTSMASNLLMKGSVSYPVD